MLPILSRNEVMQWTSQGPVTNVEQAQRWLSARALGPDVFNFAVELKDQPPASLAKQLEILGVLGSFHWPDVGYLFHLDYFGKGYATKALRAFVPAMFKRMPPAGDGGTGFDHLEGGTDTENWGSQRVLKKSGFVYCETRLQDFDNPTLGLHDSVWFRIARPGRTLEELGLLPSKADGQGSEPPMPPIQ